MPSSKKSLTDLKTLYKEIQAEKSKRVALTPPPVSPEALAQQAVDKKLFVQATRAVVPIRAETRVIHSSAKSMKSETVEQRRKRALGVTDHPKGPSTAQISDGVAATQPLIESTVAEASFTASGVGPDTLRKLKQAYWPIGAQLDLHGLTADQARDRLIHFIGTSREFGTRCVKIIHGKGYGSKQGQPVLKQLVAHWLTQMSSVQAFATPPDAHGGQGALFVLIRLP